MELKTLLETEGIEFTNVNVSLDENEGEYMKIYNHTHSDDVPIIRVNKTLLVPNKSFSTMNEAVELVKKFLI